MPETYHRLDRAFLDALRQHPAHVVTADYDFAGKTVRARLIGSALAERFARPSTHLGPLTARGAALDLRIDLWDERATGVESDSTARPDINGRATVKASPDGRWISRRKANTWIAFDRRTAHVVGSVADGERMSQLELGRPLHSQLLLWLKDRDIQTVHAGFVARDGQGVLIGGPGGSGKSTVSLACVQAGFCYLSDDYVALESHGAGRFAGPQVGGVAGEVLAFLPKTAVERDAARRRHLSPQRYLNRPILPFAVTANLAFRREIFDRVGLFDPTSPRGGESTDFCTRFFRTTGLELRFAPRAVVFHQHRATTWTLFDQHWSYGRGHAFLYAKYRNEIPWGWRQEAQVYGDVLATALRLSTTTALHALGRRPREELQSVYYDLVRKVAMRLGFAREALARGHLYF